MSRCILLAACALSASAIASTAVASEPAIVAEQTLVDTRMVTAIGPAGERFAQVFQAIHDGALSHVMLPLACDPAGAVVVAIEDTAAGTPSGRVLGSTTVDGSALDAAQLAPGVVGMRMAEFRRPVRLRAGISYALTVASDRGNGCTLWIGPRGNAYAGGDALVDDPYHGPGWQPLGHDLAFQVFFRR